jgi:hypothetical protein
MPGVIGLLALEKEKDKGISKSFSSVGCLDFFPPLHCGMLEMALHVIKLLRVESS